MKNIILNRARERFDEFIHKYSRGFPNYIKARYDKKPKYWLSYLQIFIFFIGGLFYATAVRLRSKRVLYYFEGSRYSSLHALLPASQVVIIGGPRELRYCREKGYIFHWDGYIRKLFNIFYYLKVDLAFKLLTFLVRSIIGRQLGAKGRIFLFEDTVQIGVSLALILEGMSPVICIIHGAMSKPSPGCDMSVDGVISRYNLVYDEYQKNVLEGLGTVCFVMGLTHEVKKLSGFSDQIILIEQSTPDMPTEYFECLSKMEVLYKILLQNRCNVTYRSRPGVNKDLLKKKFHSLHTGDSIELLEGCRKIFIGFNSTLLYEAQFHGHVTIGLDDSGFPLMRRFETDLIIKEISEQCVKDIIGKALLAVRCDSKVLHDPLKVRFMSALDLIERDIELEFNYRHLKVNTVDQC